MICGWKKQVAEPVPVAKSSGFERQTSTYAHGVRTAEDDVTSPGRALSKLKAGNKRFVDGTVNTKDFSDSAREALAKHGQNPMAAVIGCADSRCPLELIFDVQPGDLFVLRNAGNTLSNAEGSLVGSAEYCCGPLGTKLLLVCGHTRCGAIAGATKCMLDAQQSNKGPTPRKTTLERILSDLQPVAQKAQQELGESATQDEIAAHAVRVNVFYTIEKLLAYSAPLRNKVASGELEIHGAIFDINTGEVEFLGQPPKLPLLLGAKTGLTTKAGQK